MKLIKYFSSLFLAGMLFFNSKSFAQNKTDKDSDIGIDIIGGIGVTSYTDFPIFNSLDNRGEMPYLGYNINLSGLYSLFETDIGSPVVGIGSTFIRTVGHENKSETTADYYQFDIKDGEISSVFIDLYGGFKFTFEQKLHLYTLLNFSYSVYDYAKSSDDFDRYYRTFLTSDHYYVQNNLTINSHYKYGINALLTYDLSKILGIGGGLTFSQHQMNVSGNYTGTARTGSLSAANRGTGGNIPSRDTIYNEVSLNFVLSFSF